MAVYCFSSTEERKSGTFFGSKRNSTFRRNPGKYFHTFPTDIPILKNKLSHFCLIRVTVKSVSSSLPGMKELSENPASFLDLPSLERAQTGGPLFQAAGEAGNEARVADSVSHLCLIIGHPFPEQVGTMQ